MAVVYIFLSILCISVAVTVTESLPGFAFALTALSFFLLIGFVLTTHHDRREGA